MTDTRKRVHGIDKAGAGDAGVIDVDQVLGPCPSCGADLIIGYAKDPRTKRVMRGLLHPILFCTYYGETDPSEIESAIDHAQKEN